MKRPHEYSDTNSTHLRERADALDAQADGLPIQVMNPLGDWFDREPTDILHHGFRYRRKPTPVARPWRPEEVPIGRPIRENGKGSGWSMIQSLCTECPTPYVVILRGNLGGEAYVDTASMEMLARFWENYSEDHGWKPCTTLEP